MRTSHSHWDACPFPETARFPFLKRMIARQSWVESLLCRQWKKVVAHEMQHQSDYESRIFMAPQIWRRICGEKKKSWVLRGRRVLVERAPFLGGCFAGPWLLCCPVSPSSSAHPAGIWTLSLPLWHFLYPTPGIFFSRVEVNGSFSFFCFKNYFFSFAKGKESSGSHSCLVSNPIGVRIGRKCPGDRD